MPVIAKGMIDAGDVGRLQDAGIRNFSGLMKHISEVYTSHHSLAQSYLDFGLVV